MSWMRFERGRRLDPIAGDRTEAIVVLLHDRKLSSAAVLPLAERWSASAPTTAFDVFEQLDAKSDSSLRAGLVLDTGAKLRALDRIARRLERPIAEQRRFSGLATHRLVLVGFLQGGTVALNLALRYGATCAGVLAFSPTPTRVLPRAISVDPKIRLIDSTDNRNGDAPLRDAVASLAARGVDARGILLSGALLSEEAIRHGGSYLVELIATAHRADHLSVLDLEAGYAH